MISNEFAEYCYLNILDIYLSDKFDERKKLIKSFNVLKDFLLKLDEENPELFSGFFQRLHYIINRYEIKKTTAQKLHKIRYFSGKLSADKSLALTPFDLDLKLSDIFQIINDISKVPFPKNVPFMRAEVLQEKKKNIYPKDDLKKGEWIKFIRVQVVEMLEVVPERRYLLIKAQDETRQDLQIKISGVWFEHQNMYSPGTILHFFDIHKEDEIYTIQNNSLIALEPDYLIDVTDIADCFGMGEANPNLYFLSKYMKSTVGEAAVIGNLVNHLFDELISDPEVDIDSAFQRGLNIKPLQIIYLLDLGVSIQAIREKVIKHFYKLKSILVDFRRGRQIVEPSFISAKYGIQGRLDLLIDDGTSKQVVELKSGKAPTKDLLYHDIDKRKYSLAVWKNHVVQAVCYNMLMESAFKDAKVVSAILYSSSEENFLRNVPNIIHLKKEILKCRNYIIAVERALAHNKFNIFRKFNVDNFGYYPPYKLKNIDNFSINYSGLTELERDYFHSFTGFIAREIFTGKTGQNLNSTGFSSLWLDSIEEKEVHYSIMRHLELLPEESDFDKMHLSFKIIEKVATNAFRKGDICIAYRIPDNGKIDVLAGQLLKGSIRHLSNEKVVVSFRNKLNGFDFSHTYEWALEPDSIDSLNKQLYGSLYALLSSEKHKRNILLGLEEPKQKNIKKEYYPELGERQLDLLYRALSSTDYFLLQGPPGTGKTSYMLRYMVKNLFEHTDENIILMAYTNRAADEICASLIRIDSNFPFLRIGGKESTEFGDKLLANIAEKENIVSLFDKIATTRVFVSTIASALTNQELLKVKKFDTAIIDEASQISEPYLHSILTNIGRFILIGDEKQLPAVVTQHTAMLGNFPESLSQISLSSLGNSYFERMLANAKTKKWHHCYGMLTHQARMNLGIMQLANKLFYGGHLLLSNLQRSALSIESNNYYTSLLSNQDIIFIDTPIENSFKINRNEAKIASEICLSIYEALSDQLSEDTVGIITPFRAQAAEISRTLGDNLSAKITVDTVERFQGSERDIIIFSFAANHFFDLNRISSTVEIDGENIDRKLNVAITRAKHKLIILGNADILSASPLHRKLIEYIKENHKLLKAKE